ncbi:orotidine-5'-phosphate decarboxylase [Parvularcula flava]|uniref:Orotidine 5'-phosphate decarboxylase n=1 Tax=Aquisalinus luteolus TaxID=1566827 RepID=A0A8J3ER49_9PROT|nr:orotidine-5'-phosphate decarboxylase [Aquisalinus luteolus]NHK28243.1 orotidine-5'-phosphate decarboxylase [Aquisalinus luteolus]GGH97894.1 orotidine 5'-phosphate decarboxylase [Aquisalinus luteolus]
MSETRQIDLIDRLIVPLDVPSPEEAETTVALLGDHARFYKIGHQLLPVGGAGLARRLSNRGKKVFLDFKFLDIGATVEKGVASAVKLQGDFITIHSDRDALKGAVAGRGDDPRLKILAVTVLTSWDQQTITDNGMNMSVHDLVLFRTELAAENGADGVVASAQEAASIRARFGNDLAIVTPGVRPHGASSNDQKRIVTPAEAIRAGSDHLVIGRPILNAPNPSVAVKDIMDEMEEALADDKGV